MNKQAGYITSAHLILIGVATGYFFISKISDESTGQDHKVLYDNVRIENTTSISAEAAKGKNLFLSKCASCHNVFKDLTGPALVGFEERGPWTDRSQLYRWIRNPEVFMKNDSYTKGLKEKFGSIMTAFPDVTDEEIDSIVEYINAVTPL